MALAGVFQGFAHWFRTDRNRFCEGALFGLAIGMATLVMVGQPAGIAIDLVPAIFLLIAMFIVRRSQI